MTSPTRTPDIAFFVAEAKEWTRCLDALTYSVDSMYEICRKRNNIAGCEEAIIHFRDAIADFEKLIDSIRIEDEWESNPHEGRPQSIAWEIRGSGPQQQQQQLLQLQQKQKQQQLTAAIVKKAPKEEEWQLVKGSRNKKRRSSLGGGTSSIGSSADGNGMLGANAPPPAGGENGRDDGGVDVAVDSKQRKGNGGKRQQQQSSNMNGSSNGIHLLVGGENEGNDNPHSGRLLAPRCAMELPQTKSSMAKMAYSRKLLWQKRSKKLSEKVAHQIKELTMTKRKSLPHLPAIAHSEPTSDAVNSTDPLLRATSPGQTNRRKEKRSRPTHSKNGGPGTSTPDKEREESSSAMNEGSSIGAVLDKNNKVVGRRSSSTCGGDQRSQLASINEERSGEGSDADDNSSTRTMAGNEPLLPTNFPHHYVSRSEPYAMDYQLDLSGDEEWREMTEEEESLAQEEESLKKEIEEEESLSIDDEVEKRSPPRLFPQLLRQQPTPSSRGTSAAAAATDKPSWREVVSKWEVHWSAAPESAAATSAASDAAGSGAAASNAENSKKAPLPEEPSSKRAEVAALPENENQPRNEAAEAEPSSKHQQHYRKPGELIQLRAKLLSPVHKKVSDERQLEVRQQKAQELREQLMEQKFHRLQILHAKVKEVQHKREELVERKRLHLEVRMRRAEENRHRNLSDIVRRAKEEEQRVMATSFITQLDSENQKYEMNTSQARTSDQVAKRIHSMELERAKRREEKMAKELAAEERRRQAEEQRLEKLAEEQTRKRGKLEQAETQRNVLAERLRRRCQRREEKLELRRQNEVNHAANLMNKIQQKQDESTRRYAESLEQVKQKALGLCSPRPIHSSMVGLAEFAQPPNDALPMEGSITARECVKCAADHCKPLLTELQLLAHVLSPQHRLRVVCESEREEGGVVKKEDAESEKIRQKGVASVLEVNYEYLRTQLDESIRECGSGTNSTAALAELQEANTTEVKVGNEDQPTTPSRASIGEPSSSSPSFTNSPSSTITTTTLATPTTPTATTPNRDHSHSQHLHSANNSASFKKKRRLKLRQRLMKMMLSSTAPTTVSTHAAESQYSAAQKDQQQQLQAIPRGSCGGRNNKMGSKSPTVDHNSSIADAKAISKLRRSFAEVVTLLKEILAAARCGKPTSSSAASAELLQRVQRRLTELQMALAEGGKKEKERILSAAAAVSGEQGSSHFVEEVLNAYLHLCTSSAASVPLTTSSASPTAAAATTTMLQDGGSGDRLYFKLMHFIGELWKAELAIAAIKPPDIIFSQTQAPKPPPPPPLMLPSSKEKVGEKGKRKVELEYQQPMNGRNGDSAPGWDMAPLLLCDLIMHYSKFLEETAAEKNRNAADPYETISPGSERLLARIAMACNLLLLLPAFSSPSPTTAASMPFSPHSPSAGNGRAAANSEAESACSNPSVSSSPSPFLLHHHYYLYLYLSNFVPFLRRITQAQLLALANRGNFSPTTMTSTLSSTFAQQKSSTSSPLKSSSGIAASEQSAGQRNNSSSHVGGGGGNQSSSCSSAARPPQRHQQQQQCSFVWTMRNGVELAKGESLDCFATALELAMHFFSPYNSPQQQQSYTAANKNLSVPNGTSPHSPSTPSLQQQTIAANARDSSEWKQIESEVAEAVLSPLITHIYARIRQLSIGTQQQQQCGSKENSAINITSTTSADEKESTGAAMGLEKEEINHFLSLWLAIHRSDYRRDFAEVLIPSKEDGGEGMAIRLLHIFHYILQTALTPSAASNSSQQRTIASTHVAAVAPQLLSAATAIGEGSTAVDKVMLTRVIQSIGYFAAGSELNQALCVFGWHQNSLLVRLCLQLPFELLNDSGEFRHILLPTLLAILEGNKQGVEVIRGEFCLSRLINFVKEAEREPHAVKYRYFARLFTRAPSTGDNIHMSDCGGGLGPHLAWWMRWNKLGEYLSASICERQFQ